MFRWAFGLFLSLCLIAPLAAAPSSKNEAEPPAAKDPREVSPEASPFAVTQETEVRLDGQITTYEAIPDDAIIMNMQVAQDRRTIVRIHFRSK